MPANQASRKRRRQRRRLRLQAPGRLLGWSLLRPDHIRARKRVVVYGKTLQEARDKLLKAMQQARSGIPVPDESWKLGAYLEYWLEHVVIPEGAGPCQGGFCRGSGGVRACVTGVSCFPDSCHVRGGGRAGQGPGGARPPEAAPEASLR